MNYKKIYDQLIQKRRQFPLSKKDCYCEEHHAIPKCMGGQDTAENLVNLTAREHYIAHVLLAKAYKTYSLCYAVVKMRQISQNHSRDFKFNSRLFERIRLECYKKQGEYFKQHPVKSWNKGKTGIYSKETLRKMSESAKKRKPRKFSDEARKHMSQARRGKPSGRKGKHWYNNGIINVAALSCPDGFMPGLLKPNNERQNLGKN